MSRSKDTGAGLTRKKRTRGCKARGATSTKEQNSAAKREYSTPWAQEVSILFVVLRTLLLGFEYKEKLKKRQKSSRKINQHRIKIVLESRNLFFL